MAASRMLAAMALPAVVGCVLEPKPRVAVSSNRKAAPATAPARSSHVSPSSRPFPPYGPVIVGPPTRPGGR